jgi:hypothetical protein
MAHAAQIASALKRTGRLMTLRRNTQAPGSKQIPFDVSVIGLASNYKPQQLIGTIQQGDTQVTLCNKEIAAAQWPGPPKQNDILIFDGRTTIIQAVESKFLGEELLAYFCQVRG